MMDRMPCPLIQMNPADMTELKLKQGDLVEISPIKKPWPSECRRPGRTACC